MLDIKKISSLTPYSEEWFFHRLGYLTSSRISCICSDKGIGDGGMTYIRNKVYERITKKSTDKNISTEATVWGIHNEPFAIKAFQERFQIPIAIVDKHIVFDDLFSSTPDALLIRDEKFLTDKDGFYNCETLESKSYMTPSVHMEHVECKTPKDIRDINKPLYWQVISQMFFSDVIKGNAIFFHPDFPETSKYRLGHVQFKKIDLIADFKHFATRLEEARKIFNTTILFSQS